MLQADRMAKQRCCDVPRLMHEPPDRDTPERRDWSKLPPDLAAEIGGRLLRSDVVEYARFRAVCKPWRRWTDDPRALHSRFLPRNWVVLRNSRSFEEARCRLLNVATGASIVGVDIPELSGSYALGYAEGLVVLWNTATSGIRLLNPLTRAVTDLPEFSSVFANASKDALESAYSFRGFGIIDGGNAASAAKASPPTVVLFLCGKVPILACIRLGEPHWALVDTSELAGGAAKATFLSVLSVNGRFYLSTSMGDVLTVELHPEPRLVYVIKQAAATPTTTTLPAMSSFVLAPSSSDGVGMLLVRTSESGGDDDHHPEVEVFEVDIGGQKLIPTTTVGANRAVFIGSLRTLSVSTELFPSIAGSANAVYFCHVDGPMEKLFYVFHVDSGRGEQALELEFFHQRERPMVGPFNLDVCLAYCVDVPHGTM